MLILYDLFINNSNIIVASEAVIAFNATNTNYFFVMMWHFANYKAVSFGIKYGTFVNTDTNIF